MWQIPPKTSITCWYDPRPSLCLFSFSLINLPPLQCTRCSLQVGLPVDPILYLYNIGGFVPLQNALDMFILASVAHVSPLQVPLQQVMSFPHFAVTKDNFQSVIENVLPFFLMVCCDSSFPLFPFRRFWLIRAAFSLLCCMFQIAYMYPFSRLVKEIVEEKEARIKEGMKTMVLWPHLLSRVFLLSL
jgi:hypothetical protein